MPVNDYSVGRDVTVNINTPTGSLRLSTITGFQSMPNVEKGEVKGLDGKRRPLVFPNGWNGKFDVARQDDTLDAYWAQVEANYYAGQDIGKGTVTETITEANGAVSQYKYLGCIFILEQAGDWKGNSDVPQVLSFEAQQRVKVA